MRRAWWTCRLRSYKWWHPVFFWIVDSCIINANIVRNAHLGEAQGGEEFVNHVVRGLLESEEPEGAGAGAGGAEAHAFSPRRHRNQDLPAERLAPYHEMGKLQGKRSNCKLCVWYCATGTPAYKAKTSYFCRQCGDWLHFECFHEYHTKTRPVSKYEK